MTVNMQIDIGQILVVLTMLGAVIGAHYTMKARLDGIEEKLAEFGARLLRHEESVMKIVGDVQRIVGRLESR